MTQDQEKAAPAAVPAEHLPTAEHIRELAQEALDQIMEQAQVFASAWSLVGGRFDSGSAMSDAEDAKAELRTLVRSLADLAAETVRPAAPQPAQPASVRHLMRQTPYDPTQEMIGAVKHFDPALPLEHIRAIWWAMWRAAPSAQAGRAMRAPAVGSDDWQQYAKEGETAQACIERHRGEHDSLLNLLTHARTELGRAYRCIQGMHHALGSDPAVFPEAYHAPTIGAAKRYVFDGALDGADYFIGKPATVLHAALALPEVNVPVQGSGS